MMRHQCRTFLVLAAQFGVAAFAHAGAYAGSTNVAEAPGNLQITITPFYGWVPGMTGNVSVFDVDAAVDVPPLDVVRNITELLPLVDGLYLGGGEIRYQNFGFLYDILFMDVSIDQGINGSFIKGSFGVDLRQSTTTLAGSYRVLDGEHGHLDAIAGVRIWDIETNLQLDTNILSASVSDGDRWVDPMIGLKGSIQMLQGWALTGWALIGGFGAGSDLAWDFYGSVDHAYSDRLTLSLGFRALSTDYQNGEFSWDMIQYGPMVNASFEF